MKLVLIDRDGVLNEDSLDYIKSLEEFIVYPQALEALALLRREGFTCVVITNQAVVGRGIIPLSTLEEIHARLHALVNKSGGRIEEILFCTDHPDRATDRRKPGAGMLLEALNTYKADAKSTPMIGDTLTDMMAAKTAGCPRYLVMTGKGEATAPVLPASLEPVTRCADILDAAHKIVDRYPS